MKQIAGKFGANEKTLDGLAGLGDLVATGFAQDSHNRKMGEFLAAGMEWDKALAQLGGETPEGFRSLPVVLEKIGDTLEAPLAKLIQTGFTNQHPGLNLSMKSGKFFKYVLFRGRIIVALEFVSNFPEWHHVLFKVKDADLSIRFYSEYLGMGAVLDQKDGDGNRWVWLRFARILMPPCLSF